MAGVILLLLVALWILGYIHIPGISIPNYYLLTVHNHSVTLWGVLILLLIIFIIDLFPSPLKEVAVVALFLWILSLFGVITVLALPHIIIIALVVGLILSILA